MIVVDTSALIAVTFGESDYARYVGPLDSEQVAISAMTLTEAQIVAEARGGADATDDLGLLLRTVAADVVAVDAEHARTAFAAWRRFGKGRHPARLNLGDCFSYATAHLAAAPLLFKGQDFAQTDLRSALG